MKERIKKAVELRNQGKLEESNEVMKDLVKEYPELPEVTHQEIVDAAVRLYLSEAASTK